MAKSEGRQIIGLCGAHRTGKTTLAKAWSKATGIQYLPLNVTDMMTASGVTNESLTSSPDLRLEFQRKVVDRCHETWVGRKEAFVSDRTPLDVAAYTLADAQQGRFTDKQQSEVLKIVEDCIDITNAAFGGLIYVRPMFKYVPAEGKPAADLAYQALHGAVVLGLLSDHRQERQVWHLNAKSVKDRCEEMDAIWEEILEDILESDETDNPTRWLHV